MTDYEIQVYSTVEQFKKGLYAMSTAGWTLDSWQEISEPKDEYLCFVVIYRLQK